VILGINRSSLSYGIVSGGLSALLSRPGTNYTERSCSKRSVIDEISDRNDSSAAFLAGESGFGGLSDIGGMPDFIPVDTPINGGSVRFPSADGTGFWKLIGT
jgi:hypothetical protein